MDQIHRHTSVHMNHRTLCVPLERAICLIHAPINVWLSEREIDRGWAKKARVVTCRCDVNATNAIATAFRPLKEAICIAPLHPAQQPARSGNGNHVSGAGRLNSQTTLRTAFRVYYLTKFVVHQACFWMLKRRCNILYHNFEKALLCLYLEQLFQRVRSHQRAFDCVRTLDLKFGRRMPLGHYGHARPLFVHQLTNGMLIRTCLSKNSCPILIVGDGDRKPH